MNKVLGSLFTLSVLGVSVYGVSRLLKGQQVTIFARDLKPGDVITITDPVRATGRRVTIIDASGHTIRATDNDTGAFMTFDRSRVMESSLTF